jgi:hypothetical protein
MHTPADLASLGLPPADQVGFVVRDLEASMKLYGPLFGPWSLMDGSVNDSDFRGRSSDVKLNIAFGQSGPLKTVGYQPAWYKKWCADTTFVYMERPGDPLWIEFLQMPPGGPGTA